MKRRIEIGRRGFCALLLPISSGRNPTLVSYQKEVEMANERPKKAKGASTGFRTSCRPPAMTSFKGSHESGQGRTWNGELANLAEVVRGNCVIDCKENSERVRGDEHDASKEDMAWEISVHSFFEVQWRQGQE